MTNTNKKLKLFRLTIKRKIMLDSIITTINGKIESVNENSFGRMLVEASDKLSEAQKQTRYDELDKELKIYNLYHDVLETVACHSDEWNMTRFIIEERGWKNEWDIPLDVFNESIDGVIELMKFYQNMGHSEYRKNYDKKIAFLLLLREFRNNKSSE